jgi:hypothetical protein
MKAGKTMQAEPLKKRGKKICLSITAICIVLILIIILLIPALISSDKARGIILSKINSTVDGRADFSDLSMSWFKGLKITDLSFSNNAGQTSVAVKQLSTRPHYGALLVGSLSFGKTVIDQPKVEIKLKGPATKAAEPDGIKKQTGRAGLPIKRIELVINSGNVKVTDSASETVELSDINTKLNLQPPGQASSFDVDMTLQVQGRQSKITAAGQVRPKTGWTLKGTTGDMTVKVDSLELESISSILGIAGVDLKTRGDMSVDIKSSLRDGKIDSLDAVIKAKALNISGPMLKGDHLQTEVLDVDVKLQGRKDTIKIEQFKIHSDWADAQADGVIPTSVKSMAQFLKSDSKYDLNGDFRCDLAAVLSQMPKTFGIKDDMRITSGKLYGSVATVTSDGARAISGSAALEDLAGMIEAKAVRLSEPIRAEVLVSDAAGELRFDKANVTASFGRMNFTGTSKKLDFSAEIDLAKVQSELGQFADTGGYEFSGGQISKGRLLKIKDDLNIAGQTVLKDLRIVSAEGASVFEPAVNFDYAMLVKPADEVIKIDFIRTAGGFGQVEIKNATVPMDKESCEPTTLDASAKLDLEKLTPYAVLAGVFPKQVKLAGHVESKLSVRSQKNNYYIKTDSTKIKNLKITAPDKEPFEQSEVTLNFDAEVNPAEKTINIKQLQLISPQIKIKKGQLRQDSENGQVKLDGLFELEYDWSAVSAAAAAFMPEELKLQGKRTDTVRFVSRYPAEQPDKLLANLDSSGKIGFEKADYMGLHFGPTEIDIQVRKGLLTIAPFVSNVNNGQLSFAASADFEQTPTLLKTPNPIQIAKDIHINDETTKRLLKYLNPVFAGAVNVSGVANFDCEKLTLPLGGGKTENIEMIGTVSISRLRLEASDLLGQIFSVIGSSQISQDITIQPTRFILQKGRLEYDDMQMDIGNNPVNFKGVIGLDKSLDMTVTLPYTIEGRTAKSGQETADSRVRLPLEGTLDKPKLNLGKLIEQQLKQQLKEKVPELQLLEELFKK